MASENQGKLSARSIIKLHQTPVSWIIHYFMALSSAQTVYPLNFPKELKNSCLTFCQKCKQYLAPGGILMFHESWKVKYISELCCGIFPYLYISISSASVCINLWRLPTPHQEIRHTQTFLTVCYRLKMHDVTSDYQQYSVHGICSRYIFSWWLSLLIYRKVSCLGIQGIRLSRYEC